MIIKKWTYSKLFHQMSGLFIFCLSLFSSRIFHVIIIISSYATDTWSIPYNSYIVSLKWLPTILLNASSRVFAEIYLCCNQSRICDLELLTTGNIMECSVIFKPATYTTMHTILKKHVSKKGLFEKGVLLGVF